MTDRDPLLDALDAERPDSWIPSEQGGEGATLVGFLVGWSRGVTQKYGEKDIALIRDEQGKTWGVWLLSQVLCDEFYRAHPEIGERVAVRFVGTAESQHGNEYQIWRVAVEGRVGAAAPSLYADPEREAVRELDEQMGEQVKRMVEEQGLAEAMDADGTFKPLPEPPGGGRSVDEIAAEFAGEPVSNDDVLPATPMQILALKKLAAKAGVEAEDDDYYATLTRSAAERMIVTLQED